MNLIKTSLALALAATGLSAQAAHFQIVGPSLVGGYTHAEATTSVFGTVSADALVDD
ncbi:MAG: PEP-CTERM sorting domain-containing protein, partial [Methyloversatilis sp.]|nr:PEP-CTERM sorting domain-containing protein [Methyloversatilis sp.]